MIIEYYRPATIEEALELIGRVGVPVFPMGGGTALERSASRPLAVVDLQDLQLSGFRERGNQLEVGATTLLQAFLEQPGIPDGMRQAIAREASYNLRQVATVAGTLVVASGRSPLATVMLALDAKLALRSNLSASEESSGLGDLLPFRQAGLKGRLITRLTIPTNVSITFESTSRTPADLPIVCCAVATWPAGRTRVALGGHGPAPILAFDGPDAHGAEIAAREAYSRAGDEWATAAYRQDVAGLLVRRCMEELKG
ncbi:MAG TPA: FAD binding domain-containing protein [Anaerolineales bacterium]|nr:FAD binding domain-containing protein [Anaerolineales bacterium]